MILTIIIISIIILFLAIDYTSFTITKKIFKINNLTPTIIWKIIVYTSISLLIPLLGIIISIYLFYKYINKEYKITLGKTILIFIVFFIINTLITISAVLFTRTLIVPFQISGQSMANSFNNHDLLLISKFDKEISRGDVVVFKPGVSEDKQYYIKRVIGLPGETIKIENGQVYVKKVGGTDFIELQENYLSENNKGLTYIKYDSSNHEYIIPTNSYFLMGDNRNSSIDSRECFYSCALELHSNFIEKKDIVGKVFIKIGNF
ncbi:MAG: signal peptidase I [Candidatus Gracilibacteria bacterium]|nr:signal peptidase I [Candidatus Gracilibacteria bacterium]